MNAQTALVLMWLGSGILFLLLSVPLVAGRVPRNGLYGFRTNKTLGSDEVWYPANSYAGRQMAGAGVAIVLGAAALLTCANRLSVDTIGYLGLGLVLIPLLVAVVRSAIYLRTL